jgi:phytoene/squalene synthetase
MTFAVKYRQPIYSIYGFVRLADEIVDSFHGYDKKKLLADFRKDTFEAISSGISTNPILHSFQQVIREYNINLSYIEAFLDSMEMDLHHNFYEQKGYNDYIYGSAEVVGLMCLKVFVDGDQKRFDELLLPAKALGSAFQKVNFLRDIKSDIEERGRIYLPGINQYAKIDDVNKKILEAEIEEEFSNALKGIRKLPIGVKLGVYSAFLYYVALFKKIKSTKVERLMKKRIRVSNTQKFLLLVKSYFEVKVLKTC